MWGGYYRHRGLKKIKGGIKLQSKRGESARTWWGKRWNEILYDKIDDNRLARARSYARRGQVESIDVKKGGVYGVVYGSDDQPYKVSVKVQRLGEGEWKRVADSLMARPAIAAKMMVGQMPEDLESVFSDVGLSLFPDDLKTDCNCWDWANPCKHIAAVYLIVSERFDREPLLILRVRGMDPEDLLDMMGMSAFSHVKHDADVSILTPKSPKNENLPIDMESFWGKGVHAMVPSRPAFIPEVSLSLPRQLGSFSFWRSEEVFMDALDTVYQKASVAGMNIFLDDDNDDK